MSDKCHSTCSSLLNFVFGDRHVSWTVSHHSKSDFHLFRNRPATVSGSSKREPTECPWHANMQKNTQMTMEPTQFKRFKFVPLQVLCSKVFGNFQQNPIEPRFKAKGCCSTRCSNLRSQCVVLFHGIFQLSHKMNSYHILTNRSTPSKFITCATSIVLCFAFKANTTPQRSAKCYS